MLRISPRAVADLRRAARWYDDEQDGLGSAFVKEIDELLVRIERKPLQFPRYFRHLHRALAQRFPYSVFFEIAGDEVAVIAVFHQRQDVLGLERRLDEH